jgi:hypothetical protein
MVTSRCPAGISALISLALLAGCGRSNAERPFPAEAGAPVGGTGQPVGGTGGSAASGAPGSAGTGGTPATTGGTSGARPADAAIAPADAAARDGGGSSEPSPPPSDAAPSETTAACTPTPSPYCDTPLPDPGAKRPWRDFASNLAVVSPPRHRGRDQFLIPGAKQWAIAKFAYGIFDDDIENEDVDVYLLRGCTGSWQKLGTARTTRDGQHPTIEQVEDSGGRVYFELTDPLPTGRHRLHFVVGGDLSTTDAFIEVVPRGTAIFVSDVDGTLTTSETAEFGGLLTGALPEANPDAARVLGLLAGKGYRPLYLTARPEWLTGRTREFLAARGFPAGMVHTTLGGTGALDAAATAFKTAEIAALQGKGLRPAYAFGNTETDAAAYANRMIEPANNRVFYKYDDTKFSGRRIDDWAVLEREIAALPPACPR